MAYLQDQPGRAGALLGLLGDTQAPPMPERAPAAPRPDEATEGLDPQEALAIALDTLHDLLAIVPDDRVTELVARALSLLTKAQTLMSEAARGR